MSYNISKFIFNVNMDVLLSLVKYVQKQNASHVNVSINSVIYENFNPFLTDATIALNT